MTPPHVTRLRTYIIVLVVILLVAGVIFFMHIGGEVKPAVPYTPARGDLPSGFSNAAPAPTPADFTDQQRPFDELISFRGSDFVPAALEGVVGETVRFTNNSPASVMLSTDGTSSPTLRPGEYWQHTFRTAGTFEFTYGNVAGTITIQ